MGHDSIESLVTTGAGSLRGQVLDGVHVFKGIPFAAPPVGDLRFRPPAPAERWDGARDALAFGHSCPQPPFTLEGSPIAMPPVEDQDEDCLTLNVWSPDVGGARLPVMVWLHGGAFVVGTSASITYDGGALARRGVVVVTVNYRLGALGFLHLDGEPGSGAFGLLDQIAALRWVQEHIADFGGDPGNVTVFGESAGGMCVGSLLAAPDRRGLFRRAIAQSGAASHTLGPDSARRVTARFGQLAGVDTGDPAALRALDVDRLTQAVDQLRLEVVWNRALLGDEAHKGMPLIPVHGTDTLPQPALDAIAGGAAAGIDLIVGVTTDESRIFTHPVAGMPSMPSIAEMVYAHLFEGTGRSARAVVAAYYDAAETEIDAFSALQTDVFFRMPSVRLAEAQCAHHDAVYAYRFRWPSPILGGRLGAFHGLDVPFVFGNFDPAGFGVLAGKDPPRELVDAVQSAWVSFATRGAPVVGELAWPRYELERRMTMDLDVPPEIVADPEPGTRRLWDEVI